MNHKKLQVWFPLFFAISMVIGMYFGYQLRAKMPWGGTLTGAGQGQLPEIIDLVRNRYVDPVNIDSLNEVTAEEFVSHLDPHTVYIPAKRLQDVNEDLAGRFEGIGVEFNIFEDTVHVLNVFVDGPSDKAGLHIGDRIIKVGDQTVAGNGISSDRIRSLLRGPRDSKVDVTILRAGKTMNFTINRGVIPIYALDAAYMAAPGTGYIRLNKFSETTYEEFMAALEKLEQQGMKKLILDLRDNGGGILEEAVEMADEFLSGDKLIVYTEGLHSPRREYKCRRHGLFEEGELVVLLNEGSASASEILAGALQEWDRATIVGRRSFGKGLVQEQYTLADGAALRLTVARYYTPLGRSIQKPYDKGSDAYNEEIMDRYHHGEMFHEDTAASVNGKPFMTPGGKKVFGGGGITPDIFVAFDSSTIDTTITQLYRKNTLGNFVYRYYTGNTRQFDSYRNPEEYEKGFRVDESIYNQLVAFAARDTIDIGHLPAKDKEFLMKRIKSLLARQIWRTEGFFEVVNARDSAVIKALGITNK